MTKQLSALLFFFIFLLSGLGLQETKASYESSKQGWTRPTYNSERQQQPSPGNVRIGSNRSQESQLPNPVLNESNKIVSSTLKRGPGLDNLKLDIIEDVIQKAGMIEKRRQELESYTSLFVSNSKFKAPTFDPTKMDQESFKTLLAESKQRIASGAYEIIRDVIQKITDPDNVEGKFGYKSNFSQEVQGFVSFNTTPLQILEQAVDIAKQRQQNPQQKKTWRDRLPKLQNPFKKGQPNNQPPQDFVIQRTN